MSVTLVRLGGRPDLPLLVLGPSLGTSVQALWGEAAGLLAGDFQVVGFDLPGHGTHRGAYAGRDPADGPPRLGVEDLARDVLEAVDRLADLPPGSPPATFDYAGVSVGGCVGLQLLLDAPDRVRSASLVATGARIGSEETWSERVRSVHDAGTAGLAEATRRRWFAPATLARAPGTVSALLQVLADVDDDGYVAVCSALAAFDVRHRLAEVSTPVLALAGAHDEAAPPSSLREIAAGVRDGAYVELDDTAHLPPAERPESVARLVRAHARGEPLAEVDAAASWAREVAAGARATGDGSSWDRPGLDERSRSLLLLGLGVVRGDPVEAAARARDARQRGLGRAEVEEAVLQSAAYAGAREAYGLWSAVQHALDEAEGSAG